MASDWRAGMITPFIPKFVFSVISAISYILRTDFVGASSPTGDGVVDGTRTPVDTSTGTIGIVSNKQAVTGSGVANETGIIELSVTREKGLTYQHKFTVPTAGNSFVGFHTSAAISTQISGVRISGTDIFSVVGATQYLVGTVTVGQEYTITEVLDTSGFIAYIKGGTEYSTNTVLYVDDTDSTATVHPQNQTVAAVQTLTDDYLIPETLNPELVTPDLLDTFTEAGDTILTSHTPDVGTESWVNDSTGAERIYVIAATNTAENDTQDTAGRATYDVGYADKYIVANLNPGTVTDNRIWVRRVDSANYIYVRFDQSDNKVKLGVTDDGVTDETVVSAGTYSDNVTQEVHIIAVGSLITVLWDGETLVKDIGVPTTAGLLTSTKLGFQLAEFDDQFEAALESIVCYKATRGSIDV
jgi:hypothetical protein